MSKLNVKPLPDAYLWPLGAIEPNPDFPREGYVDSAIEELAGQIKMLHTDGRGLGQSGIVEPLVVFVPEEYAATNSKDTPSKVVVQADNLTFFAARLALPDDALLPVVISSDEPAIARLFGLRRSLYQSKYDFLTQAAAVAELVEATSMTYDEVGAFLGENKGWVQLRVDVFNAGEDVKKLIRTHNLSASGAQRINRVLDEDARSKFIQQIKDGVPYFHLQNEVAAQLAKEHDVKYAASAVRAVTNRAPRRSRSGFRPGQSRRVARAKNS